MGGTPVQVWPILRFGHVVVYFDAAWISRVGKPRTVAGAFVLPGEPFGVSESFAGDVSVVASWWKLRIGAVIRGGAKRLLEDEPGAKGIQIYDMLSARAAIMHLRFNKVRLPVLLIGDNRGVISFMRDEGQLKIEFSGTNVAPSLRDAIRKRARKSAHVDWAWIRREENLAADATAKRAAPFLRKEPRYGNIVQVTYWKAPPSFSRYPRAHYPLPQPRGAGDEGAPR